MIQLPDGAAPGVAALLATLAGHPVTRVAPDAAGGPDVTVVVAASLDEAAPSARARTDAVLQAIARRGARRVLILSRLGTHRDARHASLRAQWAMEEGARAPGAPALTLRLAPVLGPATPFWRALAGLARDPRAVPARERTKLLQPVVEEDVRETLTRALSGAAAWAGWYEVAGAEPWSLEELIALARGAHAEGDSAAACEPPLAELADHRLAEAGPWCEHFGLAPTPIARAAGAWAGRAAVARA